jgi:thiol:disulfide interchange protein
MAVAYGLLGFVVVYGGQTFGGVNASWLFNGFVAIVFTILGLAMFDVIQIDFTRYRNVLKSKKLYEQPKGTVIAAFGMGILSALLAGACIAPVVISVVIYATSLYAGGNYAGLFLPFFLGVGMALPWPFAGAGLGKLPKPGVWMTWVKYAFGIIIIITALWYGHTAVNLYRGQSAIAVQSEESGQNSQWIPSLAKGLAIAQAEHKPVIIDFWATWCKNCKAMDATTLRDIAVEKKLNEFVRIKYQSEDPSLPKDKEVLSYFKIIGLPTYVVLVPK